jgi:hypothetical protein
MDLRDAEAQRRIERDGDLQSHILSVEIPIRTTGGRRLHRGPAVACPSIARAAMIVPQAERWRARGAESGSDVDWTAVDTDEPIEPAPVATWVFRYEDHGERIKR